MGVAAASVLAPLAFWAAVAMGSALRPGYDQIASTISRLSVGPNGAILDAAFVAYGTATVAIGLVIRGRLDGRGRSALALLAASGTCTAALGVQWALWTIAGASPISGPRPGLTMDPLYDLIHDAFAAGSFTLSGVGSLLIGLSVRGREGWRHYDLVFVALAALVFALEVYLGLRITVAQGLVQRVAVVALQAWVAVLAFRLYALERGEVPADAWPAEARLKGTATR